VNERKKETEKRRKVIRQYSFHSNHSLSEMQRSQAIPFKVPLYEDPRGMSKQTLISRLNDRNLNASGTIEVLNARLLKAVVEEGLNMEIDPHLMDDLQPEKWTHIANLTFQRSGQDRIKSKFPC
jgi:hypothetical protein